MKVLFWALVLAFVAVAAGWFRHALRKVDERRRAEEARLADFMAQAVPRSADARLAARAPLAPPDPTAALQKLLFDAAGKASAAGEPALAIQLYARLLARYPQSALAGDCRAAVEELKAKLAIARARGPAGPG